MADRLTCIRCTRSASTPMVHFQAGGKKDKSYFELMTMEISPSTATGGAKNHSQYVRGRKALCARA